MAITRAQTQHNVSTNSTSIGVTVTATTVGSLLIAIIVHGSPTAGGPGTYTPPAGGGWTQFGSTISDGNCYVSLWYKLNAASLSATGNWSFTQCLYNTILFAEYTAGAGLTWAVDGTGSTNTGATTPLSTGTATITGTNDVLVAALGQNNTVVSPPAISFTTPTNSFTLVLQTGQHGVAEASDAGLNDRFPITSGTSFSTGVTTNTNSTWCAILAAFSATAAASGSLFKPANLVAGAGGPFFSTPA